VLALRHFDGLQGADIKPWLFQILRNVCRTEYQLRQDDPLQTLDTEPAEVTKPRSLQRPMTPERLAIQDQEAAVLRRLILALPVQLREALVLREYNGLTYQEIAKVTGAPAGTVMSRLSLARENISAARKNAAGPLASGSSKELVFGPR
jgi:RNA polymerase sigma-70 factor (ECF subfamily)